MVTGPARMHWRPLKITSGLWRRKGRLICARGKCAGKTSRCKAVVLDDDLAGAVRTFMHRDDDGDPSFGWLIGGSITAHCACVEKRRPNKPVPAAAPGAAVTGATAPEEPVRKKPIRKTTGRPRPSRRQAQT